MAAAAAATTPAPLSPDEQRLHTQEEDRLITKCLRAASVFELPREPGALVEGLQFLLVLLLLLLLLLCGKNGRRSRSGKVEMYNTPALLLLMSLLLFSLPLHVLLLLLLLLTI